MLWPSEKQRENNKMRRAISVPDPPDLELGSWRTNRESGKKTVSTRLNMLNIVYTIGTGKIEKNVINAVH
jgi:hypothetical protein